MNYYLNEIPPEENWSIEDVKHAYDKIPDNELNSIIHMLNSPDKEISNLGYELFMSYKNG
jgi:hypothetical protein